MDLVIAVVEESTFEGKIESNKSEIANTSCFFSKQVRV